MFLNYEIVSIKKDIQSEIFWIGGCAVDENLKCKQDEEQSGFTYFLTVLHVFSHLFVLKI